MLIVMAVAILQIDGCINNDIVNEKLKSSVALPIVFIVFSIILLIIAMIFLSESPCFKSNDRSNEKIIHRL